MSNTVFRTVVKSPETGRLDRAWVREVVAGVREERMRGRPMMVREPRAPYGVPRPEESGRDGAK